MAPKTLITGGAGFVGSHLAALLLERGREVHVLDNFSTGRLQNLAYIKAYPRLQIHEGSVLDPGALDPFVECCDEVYHLAAAVGVRLVIDRPVQTIVTNVRGTENVLESAVRHRRKVLVASTSEVYGKNKNGPLREDDDRIMGSVTKRRWAYANTKTLDEFLALAYHQQYGLPVVIARLFNTAGPRQAGRYGMVIPSFVDAAMRGEPIRVFGTGQQTRCFAYVGDVVRGLADLMGHPGAVGQIFNVGNDHEISIAALAGRVKEITGSSSPIEFVPYEKAYGDGFEDMERRVPDLAKIRRLVGYEPTVPIDEILRQVIAQWQKENGRVA